MNRRNFIGSSAATVVSSVFFLRTAAVRAAEGAQRPNVLFVLADQWRHCAFEFGPYHDGLVKTPNFKTLVSEGLHWTRCYATQPVCTPNRSALITGRYPHETGMNVNDIMLPPDFPCLADIFTDAGYRCCYIGKWHMDGVGKYWENGGGYVPKGWRRRGFTRFEGLNRGHYYYDGIDYPTLEPSCMLDDDGNLMALPPRIGNSGRENFEPHFQADRAMQFMAEMQNPAVNPAGDPFFCFVSWGPPHTPYNPPVKDDGTIQTDLLYCSLEEIRDNVRPNIDDPDARDNALRRYFANCTALDQEFGRLMTRLDELGLKDNTIVVFSADHGDCIGCHGIDNKGQPEEESWHIPLFMRWPGHIPAGAETHQPVSTVDLTPTLLGLCGLELPAVCSGIDKSAIARGDEAVPAAPVFGGRALVAWVAVVKGDYKLCRTLQADDTYKTNKLFRLCANGDPYQGVDPYELNNLVDADGNVAPEYAAVKQDLENELDAWMAATPVLADTHPELADADGNAKADYDSTPMTTEQIRPFSAAVPGWTGNSGILRVQSQSRVRFTLQESTDMVSWTDLETRSGNGNVLNFNLDLAAPLPARHGRFYRVQAVPA